MSTYVRNLAKPMQGCLPFGRSLDFTFFNGRVSTSAFCYAISDSNHFMSPSSAFSLHAVMMSARLGMHFRIGVSLVGESTFGMLMCHSA